jgi:integration host factor subunit beta
MTKSDLIERVARHLPHISKKDTELVVNTIFDRMTEALVNGRRIEIRGFGSFQVKLREAREGRNPKTGEEVRIPRKRTPFFKVGKELKERIDQAWRAGKGRGTSASHASSSGAHAASSGRDSAGNP